MMGEEGLIAQQIVAESIALRKAMKEKRLVEVSETPQPEHTDSTLNQENQQVVYQDNCDIEPVVEIPLYIWISYCINGETILLVLWGGKNY